MDESITSVSQEVFRRMNKLESTVEDLNKTHYNLKTTVAKLESREFCEAHVQMVTDLTKGVQALADYVRNREKSDVRIDKYIDEGERQGGYRERLSIAEVQLKSIEKSVKSYWKASVIAGVLGGLLGRSAPDFVNLLANVLRLHLGG